MNTPVAALVLAIAIAGGFSCHAEAALPDFPGVIEFAGTAAADRADADAIGKVDLLIGEGVLRDKDGTRWAATAGTPIKPGDVLRIHEGAKARLSLKSGDALHLGGEALIGVVDASRINIWTGRAAVYVQPVEGGRPPLALETSNGLLETEGGKLGLHVLGKQTSILAFNNWEAWRGADRFEATDASRDWRILARWRGADGKAIPLAAGRQYQTTSGESGPMPSGEEVRFTYATSPEIPALKEALLALKLGDDKAKPLFTKLQNAFPNNPSAAYHLGRIALEAQDNAEALRQWQLYSRLEPEGAAKLQMGPRLTLLIHQTLKDEIKRAMAAEAAISSAPPEPGTVAVLPFLNRGDAAHAVLSKGLTAMVITDLSKVPGLKVLERARLQKLMDEMQLSEAGLVDEKTALRAGRLLKAEKIMLGDYQLEADKK